MEWLERLDRWLHGSRPRSKNTRRQGWRKPQFMALEPRLLMTAAHLDLGTATSPPATGYVSVPVVAYTPQLGYGWTSTKGISAVDRGTSNDLTRAFHTGTNGTFEIALPNGTYQVTPTLGDAAAVCDVSNLYLEGRSVASNLVTQAGQFIQPTYTVKVTNGLLTVRLVDSGSATNTGWALDGLDVVGNAASPGVPTATLTGAPTTSEAGAAITIGSTVTDPSGATSGFTYAWSVTKNGSAFTSASGALPSFTFTPDAAATYVVKLRVTDAAKQTSTPATASIAVSSVAVPRPDALGPDTGAAGVPIQFVGIAQVPNAAAPTAGFTYTWNFGDGTTATGATPDHTYAKPGQYTVTFTAADSGGAKSTTTTATVGSTATTGPLTDFQINATNLLANVQWSNSSASGMAADGAWGVNAQWEQGTSKTWYIEEQRYGEYLVLNGLLHNNAASITVGEISRPA
jgi:PKD repeat protein